MGEEDELGGVVAGGVDADGEGPDEWVAWGVVEAGSAGGSVQSGFEPVTSVLSEQQIRDSFGYTRSETRTKAERDAAARRIVEGMPAILGKIESER